MQIKATVRYHLTLEEWLSSKSWKTSADKNVEKRELLYSNREPLWKTIWIIIK
jgi:hypothetical protein